MDIELRLLRSFVAIYERGSLSRAADALACTPAAMSMRLKMLEEEIGGRLFLRGHHRLEPTSRGSELYARALGVLAAYDELISATRSATPRRKLRVGAPDDYALGLLAGALLRLRDEMAEVELEIVCDLSANLHAALQRQDIDLALATLAVRPSAARFCVAARLDWVAAADFRAPADGVAPLAAYPEGCVFRAAMIRALDAARRPWRVAAQSRSAAGVMAGVRAGFAVTSAAAGTVPADLRAFAASDLLPPLDPAPIYVLGGGRGASAAARRLEERICEELKRVCATA